MTTARVRVDHDFAAADGVAIWLGRRTEVGFAMTLFGAPTTQFAEEGVTVDTPSLRLPEDLARALYDELARHFGGTSDVQTLRTDYLAERKRVDTLINHLIK